MMPLIAFKHVECLNGMYASTYKTMLVTCDLDQLLYAGPGLHARRLLARRAVGFHALANLKVRMCKLSVLSSIRSVSSVMCVRLLLP